MLALVRLIETRPLPPRPASIDSLVKMMDYPEYRDSLFTMLHRYRGVIALPGESFGITDKAEHRTPLEPETKPMYIAAHTLSHSQRQILDEQVKDMLQQGIIQPSLSPWNSLLFLIPKKDGQFILAVGFRKVTEVTKDDRYPLLALSDLLMSQGHGNKNISSLGLLSGYWEVPMASDSRKITAFSTSNGHFDWPCMTFALKSAPIAFQRMIITLFFDMLGSGVYTYLDDLLI